MKRRRLPDVPLPAEPQTVEELRQALKRAVKSPWHDWLDEHVPPAPTQTHATPQPGTVDAGDGGASTWEHEDPHLRQ